MMIASKTVASFHKQLETSLRAYSAETGEKIERVRRKIAFDRFLARIASQEPPSFFLKGGYAMELRMAEARATRDMDLTCLKRVKDAEDPMSELILQELRAIARIDLRDHFTYDIGMPESDIENAPYGGSRHTVVVLISGQSFVNFDLDVGGDFLIGGIEKVQGANWLEFCGIAAPLIPMISIEQQFAEKLHSYTLPRDRENTRVKDLIDLVLLLKQKNRSSETFRTALQRVFRARNTHPLPKILPEPPPRWHEPFSKMASECGLPQKLQEGFTIVARFYNEIVRGK